MSKIKIMDEILANKIAAGEVVEKTMNVVKELVENSIDAGSDEIEISLVDSGVKEIVVKDNPVESIALAAGIPIIIFLIIGEKRPMCPNKKFIGKHI